MTGPRVCESACATASQGLLLVAGAMLLANGLAFVGTFISNVDVAIVELMACQSFPPAVRDVT
jgi:hypothetical protein